VICGCKVKKIFYLSQKFSLLLCNCLVENKDKLTKNEEEQRTKIKEQRQKNKEQRAKNKE